MYSATAAVTALAIQQGRQAAAGCGRGRGVADEWTISARVHDGRGLLPRAGQRRETYRTSHPALHGACLGRRQSVLTP